MRGLRAEKSLIEETTSRESDRFLGAWSLLPRMFVLSTTRRRPSAAATDFLDGSRDAKGFGHCQRRNDQMLLLTDPTATLCTALVAGFAFGLLLLGNHRRR